MKKIIMILLTISLSDLAYSQVGINTRNPQGILHIDGAKDNPATGIPSAGEFANDVVVTNKGNLGVGTISPAEKLTIVDAGNTNQFQGTASILTNNLSRGVGIGYGGIQAIGTNTSADLNLNAKSSGNIIMQNNGTTGNVGIGVAPSAKLDVNGTTRLRNMPVTNGTTIITPVFSDTNGVLNKAVSNTYGTVINNTVSVASGATGTLITNLVDSGMYKAFISNFDACSNSIFAEFSIINVSWNGFYSIKGTNGHNSGTNSNKGPTFTDINRNSVQTVWQNVPGCQGGEDSNQFNFTLSMPSAGTINIKNNGNTSKTYQVILTRIL